MSIIPPERFRRPERGPTPEEAQAALDNQIHPMTEDEFDTKYEPIPNAEGTLWRDEHEVPENLDHRYVWTVYEGDEGTYYVPGFMKVNRIAYVVTKVPWENFHIEVKTDEPDQD